MGISDNINTLSTTEVEGACDDALDNAISSPTAGSVAEMLIQSTGILVSKAVTIAGAGGVGNNVSLFTVTGNVKLKELYGICTEATNSATFSGIRWVLYDGTSSDDITMDGINANNIAVGGMIIKHNSDMMAGEFVNNSAGIVKSGNGDKVFYEATLGEKTGSVATTIQLAFTGAAGTDIDMTFYARYAPIAGGTITAVA